MLKILLPPQFIAERKYIVRVLLTDFLGLQITIDSHVNPDTHITQGGPERLVIKDTLFSTNAAAWLAAEALPKRPLRRWSLGGIARSAPLQTSQLPVIFGKEVTRNQYIEVQEKQITLGLDVFGSAFFMLTRYEEYVNRKHDKFGRYPVSESLAYQEDFLERPIVNEYLEILWYCLRFLWPQLERRSRSYQIHLSHDVDDPFYSLIRKPSRIFKSVGADLLVRREPSLALRRLAAYPLGVFDNNFIDPFNTFDWIMEVSEKYGWRSAFYFMCSSPEYDSDNRYRIEHRWIREILRQIYKRDHEIGLHPSLNTACNPERIREEFQKLLQITGDEAIYQDGWGGRQHYLSWRNPETWQAWEDAQLNYDSSLSFSELPGFRCGTCYEYPVFNLEQRKALHLIERPLVIMERTLTDRRDWSHEAIVRKFEALSKVCRTYKGQMSVLWHNNVLVSSRERNLYLEVCSVL